MAKEMAAGRLSIWALAVALLAATIGPGTATAATNCDAGGCAWAGVTISNLTVTAKGSSFGWSTSAPHTQRTKGTSTAGTFLDTTRGPSNTSGFPTVVGSTSCLFFTTAKSESWATGSGGTSYAKATTTGACDPEVSPIVLDLDGSGTFEISDNQTNFDIDGDGTLDKLAQWIAGSGDGLLYDATLPGHMNGVKLFGDEGGNYPTGYEKLALRDVNGDGWVDGPELDGLAVWIDNGNARFNQHEALALADIGISALSLEYDIELVSWAVLEDGGTILVKDVVFDLRSE